MAIRAFSFPCCPSIDITTQYLRRWSTCGCSGLRKKRGRSQAGPVQAGRGGGGRVFVCYTTFSMPGSGCCMGPLVSMLPACWASCKTGMLHSGHTFLTSSHLMRHLEDRQVECRDDGQSRDREIDSSTSDMISAKTY